MMRIFLIITLFFTQIAQSQAGVVIGATRLVFSGERTEQTIALKNQDSKPYLIQSWIESENGKRIENNFVITPPLFRMEPQSENMLRVTRLTDALPKDKESLFWMNIKSIPPKEEGAERNILRFAINSKIKLIFRPKGLDDDPQLIAQNLVWVCDGNRLKVTNNSGYVINFHSIKHNNEHLESLTYVKPFSSEVFNISASNACNINWAVINDYGGISTEYSNVKES